MPDNNQPITTFSVARKEKAAVAIAIAGPSGSGKTKTALELAVGLAGPNGTIGVLDTEGRRALHYARQYKFEHCDFSPPYSPWRCTAAIEEAHQRFDVVIFDSASDEYEGEGGMIEMADAEGAWIKTKAAHTHSLIRYIRREPRFTIFCLRAQEKVKVEKVNGKVVFTPQGWMPICEKRFMYDMTLSLTLSPETPGMPRYDLPRKIGDAFLPLFPDGQRISREAGAGIRAWALDTDTPSLPEKPYKWTSSAGKVAAWATAPEWSAAVVKTVATWKDAQLQPALDRNIDEIRRHMGDEADLDHASAILRAFSDRGVQPPPVRQDAAPADGEQGGPPL